MSKENNKNLFYVDKVLSARDEVETVLAYYFDYMQDMSPEQKRDIDRMIANIKEYVELHYQKVQDQEDYDSIPW